MAFPPLPPSIFVTSFSHNEKLGCEQCINCFLLYYTQRLPKWLCGSIHLTIQKMQVWSLGQEDSLEEEMATHSSIRAWRIPWTGAWQATVCGVTKSPTWLSTHTYYTQNSFSYHTICLPTKNVLSLTPLLVFRVHFTKKV